MRAFGLATLVLLAAAATARPADPVVVDLPTRAVVRAAVVTVGDVARLDGGDPATRALIAGLDVAELRPRDPAVVVTRRVVEFRLRLAGIDPAAVAFAGAERVVVTLARRPVTPQEVLAAARAELLRRLPWPADAVTVEPTQAVAVRLPEVPAGETVVVAAVPHGPKVGLGRVQMDVTISAGGETLLALATVFEVKAARPADPAVVPATVVPAAGVVPAAKVDLLVRPRQRVSMVVRLGAVNVTAVGEAQQGGALGQTIPVQNVDSKKVVTARVTGPGAVEVELGGVP